MGPTRHFLTFESQSRPHGHDPARRQDEGPARGQSPMPPLCWSIAAPDEKQRERRSGGLGGSGGSCKVQRGWQRTEGQCSLASTRSELRNLLAAEGPSGRLQCRRGGCISRERLLVVCGQEVTGTPSPGTCAIMWASVNGVPDGQHDGHGETMSGLQTQRYTQQTHRGRVARCSPVPGHRRLCSSSCPGDRGST